MDQASSGPWLIAAQRQGGPQSLVWRLRALRLTLGPGLEGPAGTLSTETLCRHHTLAYFVVWLGGRQWGAEAHTELPPLPHTQF